MVDSQWKIIVEVHEVQKEKSKPSSENIFKKIHLMNLSNFAILIKCYM